MDPFKVLGIPEASITKPSDIEKVRAKTKQMFKRNLEEKRKFDAKKCLEAFEMIKRKLNKNNIGDENCKILGRSRKERELDKHFNHQSKEIKGNKDLRRELKKRKESAKATYQLPGENKERISKRRVRRYEKKKLQIKKEKAKKKIPVDVIDGLRRLTGFMTKKDKFFKCMEMLYRWIKEYMNRENRQYVFVALSNAIESGHLTHDNDTRAQVLHIFNYTLGYYEYWFTEPGKKDRQAFQRFWRVASVLRVHCYTDDAFTLNNTIQSLTDVMKTIEEESLSGLNEGEEEDAPGQEGDDSPNFSEAEQEESIRQSLLESHQNGGDEEDDDDDMAALFGGFMDDEPRPSPSPEPEASPSPEAAGPPEKPSVKSENARVDGDTVKKEKSGKQEKSVKKEQENGKEERAAKKAKKEEVKKEQPKKIIKAEVIDSDDEIEIKSESDGEQQVKEEENLISCSSDESYDEISSEDSDDGVEFIKMDDRQETIFKTPTSAASFNKLRHHFTECLGTLMKTRVHLWARPKIDAFFQQVYYKKDFFAEDQITKIEAWQARIKAGVAEQKIGEANIPLESKNPVVDARAEVSIASAGSHTWANKQFGLA